jgi:hypothetical protein
MPKTKIDLQNADRDLYSGLIRLHVLHQAVAEPIFGLGRVEELARWLPDQPQGPSTRCCTRSKRRDI